MESNPFAQYDDDQRVSIRGQLNTALDSGKLNPAQVIGVRRALTQLDQVAQLSKPEPQDYLTKTEDLIHQGAGALGGVLTGIGQEGARQGVNLLNMMSPSYDKQVKANIPEPTQGPELVGSSLLRAAELFAPGNKVKQASELLPAGLARIAGRTALEGATTGGITGLQTGDAEEGVKAALIASGMTAAGPVFERLMKGTGQKIQLSTIRPRKLDYIDDFKPETLAKMNLKGDLASSYNQVDQKLKALLHERNIQFDPTIPIRTTIDDIFAQAANDLGRQSAALKNAGDATRLEARLRTVYDDVMGSLQGSSRVNLQQLEAFKEKMGRDGLYAYGRTDPDSDIKQKVANLLFARAKQAVLSELPPGSSVAQLNAQIHELIPLRNAMLARIPVEDRNRILSAADIVAILPAFMSGDLKSLSLLGLTRLQKNLAFGNLLARNAQSATGAMSGLSKVISSTLRPNPQ